MKRSVSHEQFQQKNENNEENLFSNENARNRCYLDLRQIAPISIYIHRIEF